MAILQSYYRIITPVSKQKQYSQIAQDSQDFNRAGGAALSTISWYSQIMKGAGTRFQRYIQYDSMDNDVTIARALDIIAEEISNDDDTTNLPFEIEYQTEDDEEISETVVTTLRAAVRHWGRLQDLNNRIFRIARIMCKYGDCFFQKKNDTQKWEYLDPSKVIGIELDKEGNKVAYHLKGDGGSAVGTANKQASIEIAPAASIVHFTLSDEMGEAAPFGESILQSIFKTFKQLSMLEDSVIIYRIVRAPERRVFYIDVGNMPQQRVKMYLENIRNELRQKRIPNTSGDKDTIDGTYNPASQSEDFFFPVTSSGRSSRVEVLPGGENLGELSELKYFRQKIFEGLRIPSSYFPLSDQQQPALFNDGKVGMAYQEELRFANYIRRLQNKIESVMDTQFKLYLEAIGLNIEDWLFILRLPEPQNFSIQRQLALDTDLINAYNSVKDVKVLSERLKLKRYLNMSEDDIQMNEKMLKEELGIDDNSNVSDIRQIYDPVMMEARQAVKVKPKFTPADEQEPGEGNMDANSPAAGLPPEEPGAGGDLDIGGGAGGLSGGGGGGMGDLSL